MGSDPVKANRPTRRALLKAAGAIVALPSLALSDDEHQPKPPKPKDGHAAPPPASAPAHDDAAEMAQDADAHAATDEHATTQPDSKLKAADEESARELSDSQSHAEHPASGPAKSVKLVEPPRWLSEHGPVSRVIDVRSERVLVDSVVDRLALSDMLEKGARELTGARSTELAWRQILGRAERILLKFNAIGNELMRTNEPFAVALVHQLVDSGYPAESIMLLETPEYLNGELGVSTPPRGWGDSIPMDDRDEPVLNAVWQADAIVSIGLLKTHQIAGMSACMKNFSHGVLRRPALYHAERCAPSIVQVIGNNKLTKKLRLFIMNALRVIVRGGPDATLSDVSNYGGIVLGFDPLAVDAIGFSILESERRKQALVGAVDAPYLRVGADAGLGRWRAGEVVRVAVDV